MKKYISFFGYLGNRFNGVQRQMPRHINPLESDRNTLDEYRVNTVQQMLDNGLMSIYPRPMAVYMGRTCGLDSLEDSMDDNDIKINQSLQADSNDKQSGKSDQEPRKLLLRTGLGSRTDKGVHCIENVYTYELQHPAGLTYKPIELTRMLNLYLLRHQSDVLVRRTVMVSDNFNVFLAAKSRRYVYRLALLKPGVFKGRHTVLRPLCTNDGNTPMRLCGEQSFEVSAYNQKGEFDVHGGLARPIRQQSSETTAEIVIAEKKRRKKNHVDLDLQLDTYADQFLPITELYRCLAIDSSYASMNGNDQNRYSWQTISLSAMQQACNRFVGTHDFDSFRAPYKGKAGKKEVSTVRTITRFEILPAEPSWAQCDLDPRYDLFDWYHVVIEADSFLYRQVRKMIGTMVSVGRNEMSLNQIDYLLRNPTYHNWLPHYYVAPAHGLFLQQIELDSSGFNHDQCSDQSYESDCN